MPKEDQECGKLDLSRQNLNQENHDFDSEEEFNFNKKIINSMVASVEEWLLPFMGQENKITSQMIYDALY